MNQSALPRSGVPGLLPTQLRSQIARTGWATALPIVAHDAQHDHPGKAPAIPGWSKWARFEGRRTTSADLKEWDRRQWAAPGTGIACGPVAVIDIDFKRAPEIGECLYTLAVEIFGETPFIRQGEAPKIALIYRAAEPMPSVALKAASGSGDGLDILAENKQVIVFGIHPVTMKPYGWIGAENPLTAGPDAAPEITLTQVRTFLARAHEIVQLVGGSGGGGGGRGGDSADIVRNAFGMVIDGREKHLRNTVYAVALGMKAAGEEISAEVLADRAWGRFSETTVLEDGRWPPSSALRKAQDLLKRVADGEVDLGTEPEPIEPTYPDTAVPLAEAQAATASAVQRFYAEAAAWDARRAEHGAQKKAARAEWRAQRDDWKLDQEALVEGWEPEEGEEAAAKPDPFKFPAFDEPPPVFVLPADVGTGKTHAIGVALAGEGAGLMTALAMPTLRLADEAAKRFRAGSGIEGRVIRGRDAANPEAPPDAPEKMCREPDMVAAAIAVGAPVQESCCEQKTKDSSGRPIVRRCRHFAVCAYQQQMTDAPDVLFAAHQMLAYGHDVFKGVERVIADETFAGALLPDPSRGVSLDEIGAPLSPAEVSALTAYLVRTTPFAGRLLDSAVAAARDGIEWRRRVIAAPLRAQVAAGQFGPVLRSFLTAAYGIGFGLTEDVCTEAVRDAWHLKPEAQIYPEMPAEERRAVAQASAAIKHVRARAGVMAHLRDFLGMDGEKSGRVFLEKKETDHGLVILVRTRGIDTIAKNFRVPTLAIDATPPAETVFKTFLPQAVMLPRIAVETPHFRVRQVLDAPVSKKKLTGARNQTAVRRALLDEWIRLDRQPMLVVAQKEFADWLRTDGKLPDGMAVEHYGAIAGLDQYKAVRSIVCVGRQQPKPWNVESTAGALTGLYPKKVAVPRADGKSKLPWFDKAQRGIRMADGSGRVVMVDEHPDPLCEAIRRSVCEDQIVQAIGRGRGVWRTAQTPLDVLILADVCLDLTVAAVDPWQMPGEEVVMTADGVVLDSPSDMVRAWPGIWSSEEAAKKWVQRRTEQARSDAGSTGTNPYYDTLIGKCPRARRFRYQHQGKGQKWRAGAYDPAAVPNPRAWLEDRLGCQLANFEIQEAAGSAKPQTAAPAAPPAPFLSPRPAHVSNPAARSAALVGTLGRWLELVGRPVAVEVREEAPFFPAAAFA